MTNSKPKAVSGHRGGLLALIAVLIAGGIAAYGIWSRSEAVAELQKTADDSALPRVQVMSPKPGPAQRTLTLPGNIDAWFEAPIYAQVSGYVSHRTKITAHKRSWATRWPISTHRIRSAAPPGQEGSQHGHRQLSWPTSLPSCGRRS